MPRAAATSRASLMESSEQQGRSGTESPWQNSFMVAPMTSYPSATSRAAATELSTPPDMATSTFSRTAQHPGELADLLDHGGKDRGHPFDIGGGGGVAQAEADGADGELPGHPHGHEHVGGLDGTGGAGRAAGGRDALEVEVHQEGFA